MTLTNVEGGGRECDYFFMCNCKHRQIVDIQEEEEEQEKREGEGKEEKEKGEGK